MSVVNPLLILRQEIKAKPQAPVAFLDEHGSELDDNMETCKFVRMDSMFFLKDSATCFKSKRGSGPYYTLDAVCFLFKNPAVKDMTFTEYLQLTRRSNIAAVSLVDKKDLLSYVEGQSESMPNLDLKAALVPFAQSFGEAISLVNVRTSDIPTQELFVEPAVVSTRPLRTSNTIFKSSKDFTNVLEMSRSIFKSTDQDKPQNMSLVDSIKSANINAQKDETAKKRKGMPIIIVPAAPTAMMSMFNVKDFLQESRFVPTTDAKTAAGGVKASTITLEKQNDQGKPISYQVIDNPSRLSIEEWGRVAAVFVHGPAWQFKGWKWENPVELFQNGMIWCY